MQSFASIKTGPDHAGLLFQPACYGVYPNSIMNILLKLNLTNLGSCGIPDCNGKFTNGCGLGGEFKAHSNEL